MSQQSHEEICVREYLEKYFDGMLLKDIEILKEKTLPFTIPYIALVCMGIDFLGGLKDGFTSNGKSNSGPRSRAFIKEWMVKVNEIYAYEGMPGLIYDSIRNGIMHQAIFKEAVESSNTEDARNNNLFVRKDPRGKEKVFIHALQFADDFIAAQTIFKKEYLIEENFVGMHSNLQSLKNNKSAEYTGLIKILKEKDCVFYDEFSTSPSAPPDECEE